jgi:ABC-type polysaccharide/polyol phosphate transport system ATPase subunit
MCDVADPASTESTPAITVDRMTKVYPRHFHDARTFKEILTFRSPRGPRSREPLTALRDVSFQVRRGEMVGVIGTNGSGKSSLLRLLAGITPPTAGTIRCNGRIGTLLELGAGFHPDLSGMENLFLSGSVMGADRATIEDLLDSILDFAELRDFIHMPVKQYSSGMFVRLGFSLAAHLLPEIMLVDEVLAVGDARFQHRSYERIVEMRRNGMTAVLVSHELDTLEALCDRILWLERGEVRGWGGAADVLAAYRAHLTPDAALPKQHSVHPGSVDFLSNTRIGSGEVTVEAVRILGPDGRETQTLRPGEPMAFEFDCHARETVEDADLMLMAEHEGLKVAFISAEHRGLRCDFKPGRETIRVDFPFCPFNIGAHLLTVALVRRDDLTHFYDHHIRLHRFAVSSPAPAIYTPPLRFPVTFSLETE